jgi:hypothetical protein
LNGQQVVVSLVVITLFVLRRQFSYDHPEQGLKRALAIAGFIVPFAIAVGTVSIGFYGLLTFNSHDDSHELCSLATANWQLAMTPVWE